IPNLNSLSRAATRHRALIAKCKTIFRSPDITGDFNLHVRSNIPRTLVFFLKRQHNPDNFHVALTTAVKVSTYRLVQPLNNGQHRVDVCFLEADMDQFELIKESGFDFQDTLYKPVIPAPDNANIIKVSLRHLPPHFSQVELEPLFNTFGTLLQVGRYYNECGENIRAYTGAGYVLLQRTDETQATIPPSFDVGQHLRLQTRVLMTTSPDKPVEKKAAEAQGTTTKQQGAQPQNNTTESRSGNDRKRNKKGKRKNRMEGIETTGSATDLASTPTTAPSKASHIRFHDHEESGTVAPKQTTPPAVSLNSDHQTNTPPGNWPKNQSELGYREHQDNGDEDEDTEDETTQAPPPERLRRAAAPQSGTLNLRQMASRAFFGRH
ncbi:hypothetical protein BGZ83_002661, partial [Gryganskiella cystojenkinii]